ncbi:MAG TPA: metallophosphoesterase [Mycobacteriales bacterium]|nr:metallophosphoesterase [Mycobacteriales bacterium]
MHRTRLLLLLALAALAALTGAAAGAETGPGGRYDRPPAVEGFLVAPYLNDPGPDRMRVMFEPAPEAIGPTMAVEYRPVGEQHWTRVAAVAERPPVNDAAPALPVGAPALAVYRADLTGLASRTVHEYRVVTAAGTTPPARFRTWPEPGDGVEQGRFIAISDIQGNHIAEEWFPKVLQAIVDNECGGEPARCVETLDGIIVPGDLVNRGSDIDDWRDEYFRPGDALFRYLPQLPAMGNHDTPMEHYLYYFAPPANGSAGFEEEWYATDFLDLRLLTLQSNFTGARLLERYAAQLAFVDAQLRDAESSGKRYVLASVHAPCKSELWLPGESPQVCDFVRRLEDWSSRTGAISGHLFGHTHGYARGQSRDVPHLWLNVASAAGNIDDWGDYEMADHDEVEMSWDEYGYVLVEAAVTDTPEIRIQRQTGGDDHGDHPQAFRSQSVRDDIRIGGPNTPPAQPVAARPASAAVPTSDVVLHAPFADTDGDALLEAQWQVRPAGGSWADPTYDEWGSTTRARNVWFREDLNDGVDVDHWRVPYLADGDHCWRVRFRDEHWAWSPWSDDACFTVGGTSTSAELLANGGAEDGVAGWRVLEGGLQSVTGPECSLTDGAEISTTPLRPVLPYAGSRLFSVGGCSGDVSDRARAVQSVDVSAWADDVDAGRALGVVEAAVRADSKWDVATVQLRAVDGRGRRLDVSTPLVNQTGAWLRRPTSLLLPRGTRSLEVLLTGLRQHGSSNDSLVDDVSLRLVTSPVGRTRADLPVGSPGNGMGVIGGKGWEHPRPHSHGTHSHSHAAGD